MGNWKDPIVVGPFSGLQMMCMMYVAFQKVDPSIDLQMPLADAYREASKLYDDRTDS